MILKVLIIFVSIGFLYFSFKILIKYKYFGQLKNVSIPQNSKIDWPSLSIIIPACNEAEQLEKAALSVLNIDYPNIEFIFVNDRSTDSTKSILEKLSAKDPRMKLINISELPNDWMGKVNALSYGLQEAHGEWILFTDADVQFSKSSLKKSIYYAQNNNLDFLTILLEIIDSTIPKMFLSYLLYKFIQFIDFKNIKKQNAKNVLGQGAFILFKKTAYEKTEGLNWIKMDATEDLAFVYMMKKSGAKTDVLSGKNEIKINVYGSLSSIAKGLEKNVFSFYAYSIFTVFIFILIQLSTFFTYTIAPFLVSDSLFKIMIWSSLFIYISCIIFLTNKVVTLPFYSFIFFLIIPLFHSYVVIQSTIMCLKNKGIYWRGTFYSLKKLKKNQRFSFISNLR